MVLLLDYFDHRRDCRKKQDERSQRILSLPSEYQISFTTEDRSTLAKPIEEVVQNVHKGFAKPVDILRSYGKAAVVVHQKTNCLTEILFPTAEEWAESEINTKGPLAGIPVSLKDSVIVGGFDSSVGFSRYTGKPYPKDGAIVRILKDAGAIPYVKTNLPITLLSFESANDVWGRSTNPHNSLYSPGGSSGGEGALLAGGGGHVGIGSDVAGSVRVPAQNSGIYSLRCSTGRFPKAGMSTSMPGQEGIPSVFSPMARTLPDLTYFLKSIIDMKPWTYDHSVHPIPWRSSEHTSALESKPLNIGVLRTDNVVDPSPACARALSLTVSALSSAGHTVTDITPPAPPYEALKIGAYLLNADGCATFRTPFHSFEWSDPGALQMSFYSSLPRFARYLHYLYLRYIKRDTLWADLLHGFKPRSSFEQWKLVAQREAYKATWHDWFQASGHDFILCPPNATPALPHGAMADAVASCGYTFLWNLLDYSAGVLPVTKVDAELDALGAEVDVGSMNGVARGAYKYYDARAMAGLPVGVQVVGQRLQEEKVLAYMAVCKHALETQGTGYDLLDLTI